MDKEPDIPTLIGSFTFQDGSIGRFRATTGELLSRSYLRSDGSVAHELHDEFVLDLLIPPDDANNTIAPHTVFSAIQRYGGRGSIVCDTFNCRIIEIDNNHAIYYYDTVNSHEAPRLAFPSDTILIKDRFILVADTSNSRVVQFDTYNRKKPGEVLLDGLRRPTCLAFDEHLSILYMFFVWRYGMTPTGDDGDGNLFQIDKQLLGIESSIQQLDSIGAGKLLASMRFKGSNVAVVLEPEFD
ncbi:hypothetical protein FOL47_000751 [Perkinsus chesapeaki]|uniref:Uncharacterized protein n=1 Tax=Perkinsus chesapeaki TaxID=330153 RepID=A0A7J6ML55_PERCH|nr:hypothetical protein FOL47_000751 [Perkinsus chesapeaki]